MSPDLLRVIRFLAEVNSVWNGSLSQTEALGIIDAESTADSAPVASPFFETGK